MVIEAAIIIKVALGIIILYARCDFYSKQVLAEVRGEIIIVINKRGIQKQLVAELVVPAQRSCFIAPVNICLEAAGRVLELEFIQPHIAAQVKPVFLAEFIIGFKVGVIKIITGVFQFA